MVAPLRALHRDQKGTISILSVFAVLVLTMLLGMVMNVGRQFDGKIRMQNAADSAAYSGAAVIARGMNTLAFTNHLMCNVFAMTALMREAHERNAEQFVPSILSAWNKIAPVFGQSKFPKFLPLPTAISGKVPLEQQLVTAFGQWGNASSERILPIMETILSEELIPQYQRAAVQAFPQIAQLAAAETARRNGIPDYGRGQMFAVLWRTNVTAVGGDGEQASPTLPVVEPHGRDPVRQRCPGPAQPDCQELPRYVERLGALVLRLRPIASSPGSRRGENVPVRGAVARFHLWAVDETL